MNSRKNRPWIFISVGLLILAGEIFLFFRPLRFQSPTVSFEPRQIVPKPSVLELPPPISIPPGASALIPQKKTVIKAPEKKPETASVLKKPAAFLPEKRRKAPAKKRPNKWALLRRYEQKFELDEKYYQIAISSDRYGYVNQAVLYYKKYLFVAPNGAHAASVRARLAQLKL